jgi:hypothetical protein
MKGYHRELGKVRDYNMTRRPGGGREMSNPMIERKIMKTRDTGLPAGLGHIHKK